MNEREKFGKWAVANEFSIEMSGGPGRGFYVDLETCIAYSGWQAALSTRKPFAFGILDNDGEVVGSFNTEEYVISKLSIWDKNYPTKSPHRVVELFYKDKE